MPKLQLPPSEEKTPVTIITGFLGSGKSTLLNHVLKWSQAQQDGGMVVGSKGELLGRESRRLKNIAVIENEFGEVSIDKHIVGDQLLERENLVSMEGGCVCCSLRKDVVKAFAELERRAKAKNVAHDHILLETTGLADPSPLAFTFFANAWIAARFSLDSIICVVDAKHLMQHLLSEKSEETVNEAMQQLAFADLVLLNKIDLVDEEMKAEVLSAIKHINTTARVVECRLNGDETQLPPMEAIIGRNTFSISRALEVDPQFMDSDSDSDSGCNQDPSADEEDAAHSHPHPHSHSHEQPQQQQKQAAEGGELPPPAADLTQQQPEQPEQLQQEEQEEEGQPPLQGSGHVHGRDLAACAHRSKRSADGSQPFSKEKRPKRRKKRMHDLSDISSVAFQARGSLDEYRFNMFMRDLLTEKAKDIYRCKGMLSVHGYGNKKFVFQGVHETICYGPAEHAWEEGEEPVNQIVFIGKGLDRKALVQGFRTCVWSPLPEGWCQTVDAATGQPFFWNKTTREKSWLRPNAQPAISVHHATTEQPRGVAPRSSTDEDRPSGSNIPQPQHQQLQQHQQEQQHNIQQQQQAQKQPV